MTLNDYTKWLVNLHRNRILKHPSYDEAVWKKFIDPIIQEYQADIIRVDLGFYEYIETVYKEKLRPEFTFNEQIGSILEEKD